MKIIFTTNSQYYSKIQNWVFDEEFSHISISYNVYGTQLVFEISKYGGKLTEYNYFVRKNMPIHILEIPLSSDEEALWFEESLFYVIGKKYNWHTYFYFGFSGLFNKLFSMPLPEKPLCRHEEKRLCSEILNGLADKLGRKGIFLFPEMSIKTPQMIYNHLITFSEIKKLL